MNTKSSGRPRHETAFTLIELLVVIAIIGILAGLLLPALIVGGMKAKMKVAQTEEVSLLAAISQYKAAYNILPASTAAVAAALTANSVTNDFTCGSVIQVPPGSASIEIVPNNMSQQIITPDTTQYQNANSEIISILRDDSNYPETSNTYSHIYNPQKTIFFNPAKISSGLGSPGIDTNSIFRDPWGTPYMVTLDMNGDGKCYDRTWFTLSNNKSFNVPGDAMAWSLGPNWKNFDPTQPVSTTVNKNLVLSWK
ncbi:MAG: type II secretion system protein [Verrucomicrobiota bacterium]